MAVAWLEITFMLSPCAESSHDCVQLRGYGIFSGRDNQHMVQLIQIHGWILSKCSPELG